MLMTDVKRRRKYHSRQNKIHDVRNIGIPKYIFFINVFLRGTGCFQKVYMRFLLMYNAFK